MKQTIAIEISTPMTKARMKKALTVARVARLSRGILGDCRNIINKLE
jgi:hypothetical protein